MVAVTLAWQWRRRHPEANAPKDYSSPSKPGRNFDPAAAEERKIDNDQSELSQLPVPRDVVLDNPQSASPSGELPRIRAPNSVTIVHGSVTGTAQKLALRLEADLRQAFATSASTASSPRQVTRVTRMDEWDWWDELLNVDEDDGKHATSSTNYNGDADAATPVLILLLPTYTNGTWPPCAATLQTALDEIQSDWRVAQFPLKRNLQVAIFGLGSSAYNDGSIGQPARQAVRAMQRLGAKLLVRLAVGDDAVGQNMQESFDAWSQQLQNVLCGVPKKTPGKVVPKNSVSAETITGMNKRLEDVAEEYDGYEDDNDDGDDVDDVDDDEAAPEPEVIDVEDMGDAVAAAANNGKSDGLLAEPREMVTPSQAKALKKEGYQLIGTHSAVKLCRWTKHQLRGRGGCYKHTFYGITSYQCMEATPSLACANKVCDLYFTENDRYSYHYVLTALFAFILYIHIELQCVFCWRHHKNPVGKEWRWKTDDPDYIVEEAVQKHVRMIKETKGIPGVRMDRWKEAHTVRHCALSLVGEPIMYPQIDELLHNLHKRNISTFLVTNGQHPDAIERIRPITQLYVSVDAPTRESLIEIDRPLFSDAWERLRESLVSLKAKGQRTVARLTVVKGWNSDELSGYAELVALGQVSLVEVKGVTYCGKSDASNLNMSNTPWHHEVVALVRQLKEEIDKLRADGRPNPPPEYDLACEHKHSCSVLLARVDQFAVDDPVTGERRWKTWIDYDKFQELAAKNAADPSFTFAVEDYVADTPPWALFGAEEEGFDPVETRHRKKIPKYTQFDERGVPTHDQDKQALPADEVARLGRLMDERFKQLGGASSVVTEMRDGAKEIEDPSLMFRGMTLTR